MPRKLDIDWDEVGLGDVRDVELAAKLGVSSRLVQQKRCDRGIPPTPSPLANGQKLGINWEKEPLGKIPDEDIGKKLGVDPRNVIEVRRTRGIAPYTEQKRDRRLAGKTDACTSQALLLSPDQVPKEVGELVELLTENGWSVIFTPD